MIWIESVIVIGCTCQKATYCIFSRNCQIVDLNKNVSDSVLANAILTSLNWRHCENGYAIVFQDDLCSYVCSYHPGCSSHVSSVSVGVDLAQFRYRNRSLDLWLDSDFSLVAENAVVPVDVQFHCSDRSVGIYHPGYCRTWSVKSVIRTWNLYKTGTCFAAAA